jgi:hypothetical protein
MLAAGTELRAVFTMSESNKEQETECCPPFKAEPWHDKLHQWLNKPFIKTTLRSFWFMPIGFGKAMRRLEALRRSKNAANPEHLTLAEHPSKWRINLLQAVDHAIPDVQSETLDGTYYSRVYEGDYSNMNRWMQDFERALKVKKLKAKRIFMWYTTCPECAKKMGKNPTVIIAEVGNV